MKLPTDGRSSVWIKKRRRQAQYETESETDTCSSDSSDSCSSDADDDNDPDYKEPLARKRRNKSAKKRGSHAGANTKKAASSGSKKAGTRGHKKRPAKKKVAFAKKSRQPQSDSEESEDESLASTMRRLAKAKKKVAEKKVARSDIDITTNASKATKKPVKQRSTSSASRSALRPPSNGNNTSRQGEQPMIADKEDKFALADRKQMVKKQIDSQRTTSSADAQSLTQNSNIEPAYMADSETNFEFADEAFGDDDPEVIEHPLSTNTSTSSSSSSAAAASSSSTSSLATNLMMPVPNAQVQTTPRKKLKRKRGYVRSPAKGAQLSTTPSRPGTMVASVYRPSPAKKAHK